MSGPEQILARLQALAAAQSAYRPEAYLFLMEALERTMTSAGEHRHVTGGELLEGVKSLARERFGPMARDVLNAWGVQGTLDFGKIVFQLVDAGLLRKTPEDCLDDFADKYDFQQVFEENYFGDRS